MPLIDSYQRNMNYLRVSLTDRCNYRCVYCMPPEGIELLPRAEILRLHEFENLIRLFVNLGVRKVRLTGGEPLLRGKIVSFVASLKNIPGLEEIHLTTNGSRLAPLVSSLQEAGLTGLNISLDSLDPKRFARITLRDDFTAVWAAIEEVLRVGLPLKINVVALQDLSKEEVYAFCELARVHNIEVRFIEFMPLCGTGWSKAGGLDMNQLKQWLFERYEFIALEQGSSAAQPFAFTEGSGRIGIIQSMTQPFCGTCNRLRLSSTGGLRLCLFSPLEINLREPLRGGASEAVLQTMIQRAVFIKPKGHEEMRAKIRDIDLPKIRTLGG